MSCLACDLAEGRRDLPGGRIHDTRHWIVQHSIGPLGVGTLVVKPRRHVLFESAGDPPCSEVEAFADRARGLFRSS
jgi:hypothetical protein